MITDYEDDAHFCLKCHNTIIGLENYVSHRKAGCSRTNEGPPKSPLPSQLLPPDESFNLKADDFFSSLELRSSSKKQEAHSTSGKNFSGILTRSKTTAAIQATTAKDLSEPQQSKSGKNVWIGGHQLKELGYGDNQSKLIKAVDNLERRKEEPTRIQVYDESDEDSEEYEYDDEDSSSDDQDSPPRQHTGGKWKPTSPIQWSKTESWSVPPPTHTGGKWKPNSKRPLSPSLCYIKNTKWKPDSTNHEDESIPPPTFTGSKWVAPKKQDFSDVPPPSHTKGKWKPRTDEDDDIPPPNQTKGKWKPRGHNEDDVPPPTYTKGKWKPKCDTNQKFTPPSCIKTKLKLATNKPKLKLKSKEDEYPPPNHTKGKWKPKETLEDVPPSDHTKGKWKPRTFNEDSVEPKTTKNKSGLASNKKPQPLKQTANEIQCYREKWLSVEPSCSKDDNSFLRKSNGAIQYWCSPCNRRLASKIVYERHLNSELHFKRTLQDREFDDGGEIFLKEAGCNKIKPPETIFSNEDNNSCETLKKRNRKKVYLRCGVCHSKVNKYLIGKHLISHYHCRKGDITTPLATKMVLDNIHQVVLETPFQCSICKFYCNTHEYFLRHWLSDFHTQRKSPGYFFCMLCKYKSEDSDLMYEHLISEEHSEVVSVINRSVPIVIKKINPITCRTCDKEFMLNIQLVKHCERFNHDLLQIEKVKMEHVCDKCGLGFLSGISLARHEKRTHDMNYYMCGRCNLKFDSRSSALAHRRTTKHKYQLRRDFTGESLKKKCMHCGDSFNNFLLLKEHLNSKHPEQKVRCPQCGATFTIPQELTTHIRLKQCKFEATPETSTNNFRCEKCPFSSDNYSELLFHITLHQEPLHVSPDPKSKSKPSPRYKCTLCDKFFPKSSLLGHIRQHTNEKPFVCEVCGKSFARKNNLQYHVNNHTEAKKANLKLSLKKPYLCSTCGSSFKTRWLLQQHMFVHTGKICKCPKFGCLYTARKQSEIHIHYKIHFDTREFECNLCDYKGKTKQLLNRHKLVHKKEKKYQCPFCSFSGRNSTDVKRHSRVHTGAKPFHCPHCDYKCNNLENLRKHILSTNKHPGKSIYECKFCDFRDNFAKNFKNHLILEHSDTFRNSKQASSFIAGIYDYQFDNTISELQIVNQDEQEEEHSYHREEPDENSLKLKTKEDPVVCQVFNQPSTSKEPQMDQLLPMFIIPKEETWNLVRRYDVEEDSGTLVSFHSDNESLFEEHF